MRITALSGGVGGARMLRGLAALDDIELTAVVNVGDDDTIYGLRLAPDLDTVTYTLAGIESNERGWGRTGETWQTMAELESFPIDTTFRLGDKDLALNLFRTARLSEGVPLSSVTAEISRLFGLRASVLPATDGRLRTKLCIEPGGRWIDFQDYFVKRRHTDEVTAVRFDGASATIPAPGVLEAIERSDAVVIGPSNPILSIWPILAVPGVADALAGKNRVMAVSPLIGGRAVKGPLAEIMPMLGYEATTAGIVQTYDGLLSDIVVDDSDPLPDGGGLRAHASDTRIAELPAAKRLAREMVEWLS
jgi:LPPG:FO 2-phospho-L-lactate transferase